MVKGFVLVFVSMLFILIGNSQVEINMPVNQPYKSNAIKIDVFGIARGYSQICYEKAFSNKTGYEISIGIIGAGFRNSFGYSDTVIGSKEHYKNQFGFFISAGYKFNKLPFLEVGKQFGSNIFQGLYAKPIIYFGKYDENRIEVINRQQHIFELKRPSITFAALQIELGKEWVISQKVLLDGYLGIGYGIDDKNFYTGSYYNFKTTSSFNYCNQRVGASPGISITMGIKTGLIF